MKAKIGDLEVMSIMVEGNKDIKLSLNVLEVRTVKLGGKVTMGVDREAVQDIFSRDHYITALYIINREEFIKIKNSNKPSRRELEYQLIQAESLLKDYRDFFELHEEEKEGFEEWRREMASLSE